MRYQMVTQVGLDIHRIEMRRANVAQRNGKQLDVLLHHRPCQARSFAHPNFVDYAIGNASLAGQRVVQPAALVVRHLEGPPAGRPYKPRYLAVVL